MGIAWFIALIKISFPACNNIFSFHPESLLSNLSFSFRKVCTLIFPLVKEDLDKSHANVLLLLQKNLRCGLEYPVVYCY